ncbi:recombinase family protein [Streptomyces nigrescens]|uniref:recombinase family protein n=1 Tax=Streptomyces nigrescens TaxID=1920 RepID=UPI002250406B|nr:recombinase family protein [Streptomyces libani]MCX5446857.1 recombinase family protein [Streptomyces libani]
MIYLRVSTDRQTFGYGLVKSEKKATQYIEGKNWDHVDTFSDPGVSGSLEMGNRPDFDRLMMLATQTPRPFDVVVVQEGRAIGRTGRAFWRWVWALEDIGIHTAIVDGDIENTTPAGRREMRRVADYAETEWETIRTRTQDGLQEKAVSGGWIGGQPPYGYRIHLEGKKGESHLVLNFHEAKCLRRAREILIEMVKPNWRRLALKLNSEGWKTRKGLPWDYRNLKQRLTSTASLDAQVTFRNANQCSSRNKTKLNSDGAPVFGSSVVIPLDPIFAPWEVEELRRVVARCSAQDSSVRNAYPLSGRIFNAHNKCEKAYKGLSRAARSGRWYCCSGKSEEWAGAPICSCSQLDADALETRVWQEVRNLLGDPQRLGAMAEEWADINSGQRGNHESRIGELDHQIKMQNKAIAAVVAMAAKEAVANDVENPEEAIAEASRSLRTELENLKKLRNEAAEWQAESASAEQRIMDLTALSETASENLENMSLEEKGEFLELLDLKVLITGPIPSARMGQRCSVYKWFRSHNRLVPRAVSDAEWSAIEPLMPGKPRAFTYRQLIDAVLYKVRTGVRWCELPEEFGNHITIHSRVTKWLRSGLWDSIMEKVDDAGGEPLPPLVVLPPLEVSGRLDPRLMPWVHELTPGNTGGKAAIT